jgi:hypothetical protein
MTYSFNHHTPTLTKAQLRCALIQGRAAAARKCSRLVLVAIVLVTSGAVFFDAELGQGMRARVSSMITGLDIETEDLNGAGKYVQSTLAMLDY